MRYICIWILAPFMMSISVNDRYVRYLVAHIIMMRGYLVIEGANLLVIIY